MFPKQTKTNEEGLKKEESHLNYTTVTKYAYSVSLSIYFSSHKVAKDT